MLSTPQPLRWLFDGVALWLVMWLVPGVKAPGDIPGILITTVLFCSLSSFLRSAAWLLTFPLVLAGVAPMKILLNGIALMVSAWLSRLCGIAFEISDLSSLIWAVLVVSAVRFVLSRAAYGYRSHRALAKQRRWIGELEEARVWLDQQLLNWRTLAEERQRIVAEQQAWIEELQRARAWLSEQRDNWRRIAEERGLR
ncbi:MAG TPA: phage holin family protein [Candidatus Acidoferrales bacterium]|nr:phage holin family protein [Candidatus Acidoferrales bacterium]